MILALIITITLIALVIASYTDLKTREVPDWLNYSLIFTGLGIRLLYSSITFDWMFFLYGLLGFSFFLLIAFLMFYTGQWGGGDSKLLMGLGALLGIEFNLDALLITFLVNMLVVGAFYGILWSAILAIKNRKSFLSEIKKINEKVRAVKIISLFFLFIFLLLIIFVGDYRFKTMMFLLMGIVYCTFYLWIIIKAVEKSCMFKYVHPRKLTEGDWIAKDIIVKGKYICGPKDLGIEMPQIKKLIRLKIKKVLIKEGIPFVPTFLLGFIVTLLFGNWWIGFL